MIKKVFRALGILFILFLAGCYFFLYPKIPVVTGYAAKAACSCTYLANRSVDNIMADDLGESPLNLASISVDRSNSSASASVYGLAKRTAIHKPGLGCILLQGKDDYDITYPNYSPAIVESNSFELDVNLLDNDQLKAAIDPVFSPNAYTRAVLVLHKDTIVAERYAKGITMETPLLGWSMTKSIVNALIGIAESKNILTKNDTLLFPNWENDQRASISIRHLLQMNSGLRWDEYYTDVSDATEMLYLSENIIDDITDNKSEFKPGESWKYSSGTSNILMGILKNKLGSEYLTFPKKELFDKIGMSSAVIETDEAGNFLGSSYGYATTRDWAKFGKLFINDGISPTGERILPEDWVKFSYTPVDDKRCYYGAHWWLNAGSCNFNDCPKDLFYASGYQGQFIYIIPSEDIVIVRLGLTKNFDQNKFISEVIKSIKRKTTN